MVRLLMILSTKLNLHSAQANITAAFVHAHLKSTKTVYIHQPPGFHHPGNYVLKLKCSLYGMQQSPKYFFNYLSTRLQKQGLRQSDFDPCLFIGKKVIAVTYVDDLLFYACDNNDINQLIAALCADDILIRREGTAEGFLGVDVSGTYATTGRTPTITLTQKGLTSRIIEALGLCTSFTTKLDTPAELTPLPKDSNGKPTSGTFNYAAVVGMLLYLSGHSRPDIAFAVHQCARCTFAPTSLHEQALMRIGRYLKGTIEQGLIMTPSDILTVDCYPDADFAGLYGHEDPQDPHCARSRTGYVINVFGCPVLWRSKLQTEIALSTMEAEYIALSQSCKDFIPIMDLVGELSKALNLSPDKVGHMHVKIHEDNVSALTLAGLEPRHMAPPSKHYAIKYHWFREHVIARKIKLVKIATTDQLGDLFTKGLPHKTFSHLRSLLMG
ncbi:hypothetical protein ACHAW6_005971, partial [Cyclotella cf. meneghiniana]